MSEQLIGKVTHYFGKSKVAAIEITDGDLSVGDTVRFKGHTSDFTQKVESIQMDNEQVAVAHVGDAVGIRVIDHAREHDRVYRRLAD